MRSRSYGANCVADISLFVAKGRVRTISAGLTLHLRTDSLNWPC